MTKSAVILAVTIDVEPDCSPSWHYASPLQFRGVSVGINDLLHPLFQQFDVRPTYLINNVVLEDRGSCEILKSLPGHYELGTHLHPDFIGPDKTHDNPAGKQGLENLCQFPAAIENRKIENITTLFQSAFDKTPASFRAGRFSAGSNTIRSLARLGYQIDSSVTPGIVWSDPSRPAPVDFSHAPAQPYCPSAQSISQPGANSGILEIPVTITLLRRWLRLKPVWLRPTYSTLNDMVRVTKKIIKRYSSDGPIILNMMFHNVEVLPGLSPYCQTKGQCEKYLRTLRAYLDYCKTSGITSGTLSEIHALFMGKTSQNLLISGEKWNHQN